MQGDFTEPRVTSSSVECQLNGDYGVGSQITIVYRPDQSFSIDETVLGEHVQGTAYQIVQFTVFDGNGQNPKVFTTTEYTA